ASPRMLDTACYRGPPPALQALRRVHAPTPSTVRAGSRRCAGFTAPCDHRGMRVNTTAPLAAPLSLLLSLAAVAGAPAHAQAGAPAPAPTAVGTDTTPDSAERADSADTADTGRDLADSRRVAERLRETDGLADVTVTVRDGVAELQGVVLAPEDRERAAQVVE